MVFRFLWTWKAGEDEDDKHQQQQDETTPLVPSSAPETTGDDEVVVDVDKKKEEAEATSTASYREIQNEHQMTLSRRFARYLVNNYPWYCPSPERREMLDRAWAYFEYYALPRYCTNKEQLKEEIDVDIDDNTGEVEIQRRLRRPRDEYVRCDPGEHVHESKLYPVVETPETDLADFGVGVGVYFYSLRILAIIMFVAGLISAPNLKYYGSKSYNAASELYVHSRALRTSAICTDHSWEACPTCIRDQFDHFPRTFERYATVTTTDGTEELHFIQINRCEITRKAGIIACATMIFVCAAIFYWSKSSKRKEYHFDSHQQTSSDYAVEVTNAPRDAKDENEWRDFFGQFGHVTAVTIHVNNETLIHKLIERRRHVGQLELLLPVGTEIDPRCITSNDEIIEKATPVSWVSKLIGSLDAKIIQDKIKEIDKIIGNDLTKREYQSSEVFIVFETERAQQDCLKALRFPKLQILRNDIMGVRNKNLLFRGNTVLECIRPNEPEAIRWQDLDETLLSKAKKRVLSSFLTCLSVAIGCAIVIFIRQTKGPIYAAIAITAVNSAAPFICYNIVHCFEAHHSESAKQESIYFKLTGHLWITTALLTAVITPFTETLNDNSDSLIPAMYAIFITEMLQAPLTQILDPAGNFKRFFLAPLARDEKQMLQYFQGTEFSLAERYTDLTNVLFLTFFYAVLFPAGFFFAAITLVIHYWTDKFCLLRIWNQGPPIGNDIAKLSRAYYFSVALIVYALVSIYAFAAFPFDNACGGEEVVPEQYVGIFNATTGDGVTVPINITSSHKLYNYCNEDMAQYRPLPAFPATPSNQPLGNEWMRPPQDFSYTFSYIAIVIIVITILLMGLRAFKKTRALFFDTYKSDDTTCVDQVNFSTPPMKNAYVPQVRLPENPFPLLFCDISGIDKEVLTWDDPDHPDYKAHNALFDVPGLADKPVFSTIHHWPPTEKSEEAVGA